MTMPNTDAELLRKAAMLMRERAEKATPGPWRPNDASEWIQTTPTWEIVYTGPDDDPFVAGEDVALANYIEQGDAAHIASWHPATALAVADWLDGLADRWSHDATGSEMDAAEAVARAYLGDDA